MTDLPALAAAEAEKVLPCLGARTCPFRGDKRLPFHNSKCPAIRRRSVTAAILAVARKAVEEEREAIADLCRKQAESLDRRCASTPPGDKRDRLGAAWNQCDMMERAIRARTEAP